MARSFWYFQKKRGNRRTGSRVLGSAGEALFFAAFLVLGCGGLVAWFVWLVIPQWRVNHEFLQTPCRILQKRIAKTEREEGTVYRPELRIEYQINGEMYRVWTYDIHRAYSRGLEDKQAILKRFRTYSAENDKQYACWYDPADPRTAVLVRGYDWWNWLILTIPVSFLLIGGGGLIYRLLWWGKSAERRAAMTQRVQQSDPFRSNGGADKLFPNVPDGTDITNSPGTKLKFRLPIATSPGWALFGGLLACLFWNGIVAVLAIVAVGGHLRGDPDWVLTLFVVLFGLAGMVLVGLFVRRLLVIAGVGSTRVEISDHPLHPGERCRLLVSQSGRLRVRRLSVLLVCEEEATYRQGTNTRTETREVHRQQLLRRESFEVRRGAPYETECELAVPVGAMHSFKAQHNEINWKLIVQGDVVGWPEYRRSFPVIVRPSNGSKR